MRLVFVNRFYAPETPASGQILADVAEGLGANGHDVTVITSHSGDPAIPRSATLNGVRVLRIRGTRRSRGGDVFRKAVDFATFYAGALIRLGREARRDAVVIAMTDPPLLGVGVWLVAGWRRARVVHWVQDIYPEVAIALTGHRWLAWSRQIRNRAWRRAAACVTLGADMAEVIRAAGVPGERINVIPNPAPKEITVATGASSPELRARWGLTGKFVVAYSGNLGRVHDLDPVIAAAEGLREEPNIAFVFIGDGPRRAHLVAEIDRRGLSNVQLRPVQPRSRLQESLALGDVHLVTLRAGCERSVFPSKFHGIVAAGRPVIFIGPPDSELRRLVTAHSLGLAFDRSDVAGIVAGLRILAADPARRASYAAAAARYAGAERGRTLRLWCELLATLDDCSADPPRSMPSTG